VVIVGAGVAGLATAMRLLKPPTTATTTSAAAAAPPAPLSVVVLEARVRAGGMTGRSTAHVMQWVDDYYYKLEDTYGSEGAQKVAKAQEFAVDEVGRLAALAAAGGGSGGNANPCGFKPGVGYLIPAEPPTSSSSSSSVLHGAVAGTAAAAAAAVAGAGATAATPPTTLFASTGDTATQRALLERELAACQRAGVSGVELVDLGGGPQVGRARLALKFPHSAEVDPVALCEGLAEAVVAAGGRIFEGTRALSGGVVTGGIGSAQGEVRTTNGFVARAKQAVVTATCSPCDRNVLVHARQHPYRTFAVALEIDEGAFFRRGRGWGGSGVGFVVFFSLFLPVLVDGRALPLRAPGPLAAADDAGDGRGGDIDDNNPNNNQEGPPRRRRRPRRRRLGLCARGRRHRR
jgi:glycine/D-amino acid oxidase-like deaminating enzyme